MLSCTIIYIVDSDQLSEDVDYLFCVLIVVESWRLQGGARGSTCILRCSAQIPFGLAKVGLFSGCQVVLGVVPCPIRRQRFHEPTLAKYLVIYFSVVML